MNISIHTQLLTFYAVVNLQSPAFPQARIPSHGGNPPFREILRFAQNDVFFSMRLLNRTRTIDQIGLWKFFNKNFQPHLLRSRTLKTANKSLRRTSSCPLLCWWAQMDSNHRPHAYQACALTNWAMSPFLVEINGFEPLTPCLQSRCSSQLS